MLRSNLPENFSKRSLSLADATTRCSAAPESDDLYGKAGNDRVYGGGYMDDLHGDAGNDHFWGGKGMDSFFCGPGYDVVHDWSGQDFRATKCEVKR